MEWEKVVEKIRDIVLGEIKEEFHHLRASVVGELSGFRLAIESLNARQGNIENELKDIKKSIEYTNKRIDEARAELKAEIMQNTLRIDEVNKRIDETNKRIDETNKRIDETNKRIDEARAELKTEIMQNTLRIDETNSRIDSLYLEISEIKGDLKKAVSDKVILEDVILRIEKLETKVAA